MKSELTIYKQKKATSIAITILVILALALTLFTLFAMFTGTKNLEKKVIAPVYVFETLASEEEQSIFYSKSILELAFLQTYYDFAQNFDPENEISKKQFEDTLFLYIREINDRIKVTELKELLDINKKIEKGEFKVSVDDGIGNAEFSTPLSLKVEIPEDLGIKVNYDSDIKTSISLVELKLNSFQEIFDKINECREKIGNGAGMQSCFNELENFEAIVTKETKQENGAEKEIFKVTLTSKKKFLIDDDLRNIVINFEMKK